MNSCGASDRYWFGAPLFWLTGRRIFLYHIILNISCLRLKLERKQTFFIFMSRGIL